MRTLELDPETVHELGGQQPQTDDSLESFLAELATDVAQGVLTERQALALVEALGLPDGGDLCALG